MSALLTSSIAQLTDIPGRSAIEGLGDVVISLSMTTNIYQLVLLILGACLREVLNIVFESLPLRLRAFGIILAVCGVCAIAKPEI